MAEGGRSTQALNFAQSDKNNRICDGALMIVLSMAQTFANPASAARLAEKSRTVGSSEVIAELLELGSVSGSTVVKTQDATAENRADITTPGSTSSQGIVTVETDVALSVPVEVEVGGQFVEVILQPVKAAPQVSDVDMFEASLRQPVPQRASDATSDVLSQLVSQAKANQIEVIDVQEVKVKPHTPSTPVVEEVLAKPMNVGGTPLTAANLQALFIY